MESQRQNERARSAISRSQQQQLNTCAFNYQQAQDVEMLHHYEHQETPTTATTTTQAYFHDHQQAYTARPEVHQVHHYAIAGGAPYERSILNTQQGDDNNNNNDDDLIYAGFPRDTPMQYAHHASQVVSSFSPTSQQGPEVEWYAPQCRSPACTPPTSGGNVMSNANSSGGVASPGGASSTISSSDSLANMMSINLEQYISKRNERERSRVRNVNDAFDNLKNSLPLEMEKMSKRMSKVEILRTAISYIKNLEDVLGYKQHSGGAHHHGHGAHRRHHSPSSMIRDDGRAISMQQQQQQQQQHCGKVRLRSGSLGQVASNSKRSPAAISELAATAAAAATRMVRTNHEHQPSGQQQARSSSLSLSGHELMKMMTTDSNGDKQLLKQLSNSQYYGAQMKRQNKQQQASHQLQRCSEQYEYQHEHPFGESTGSQPLTTSYHHQHARFNGAQY